MARDIKVSFVSDTKALVTDVDRMTRSLEDGAEALVDLGRQGEKAGEQAGDGLKDGIRDGARSSERDLDSMTEDLRLLARQGRSAGDDIGDSVTRGTARAEGGLKDLKEESASTAKESAASFDGSAESIVDAFQEVAANAFIGFGPAGLIAGLAAAAGIGLISSAIQDGGDQAEQLKQDVADLTTELIDAGQRGGPSLDYIVSRLKELAASTGDGETSLKDLRKAAEGSGNSFEDLAQAYAGNADGLKQVIKLAEDHQHALEDEAASLDVTTDSGNRRYGEIERQLGQGDKYLTYLDEAKKKNDDANEAERNYIQSGGAAIDARNERIETLNDLLSDGISSWSDYYDAETGALDPQGFLDAYAARTQATQDFSANVDLLTSKFSLSSEQTQAILDQGLDFAPMLQSLIDSGLDDEFVAQIVAAVGGGQAVLDGSDLTATTTVTADPTNAFDAIKQTLQVGKETNPEVDVTADTDAVTADLDALAAKKRTAVVTVKLDFDQADKDFAAWLARKRTTTVVASIVDTDGRKIP